MRVDCADSVRKEGQIDIPIHAAFPYYVVISPEGLEKATNLINYWLLMNEVNGSDIQVSRRGHGKIGKKCTLTTAERASLT
jgi:hypothetical protein